MFPKLFFRFFCIFELAPQFLNYTEFFIIIAFFLHYFLVVWKNWFCPSIHQYLPIFKYFFENVPKIIFSIFLHFWTRTTILKLYWIFHNYSFFSSLLFSRLKIKILWHLDNGLSVLGKSTHMFIYMEATAIRQQNFHFVSLFYLHVFIHNFWMQTPIIKWKVALERRAKTHLTHCLKIIFIFFYML